MIPGDPELAAYLGRIVDSTDLLAVGVVTTDGILRFYTDGLPSGPVDLSDRSLVSDALRTGQPAIGDRVTISRATGLPVLGVSWPVHDDSGELIQLLTTPFRFDGGIGEDLRFARLAGLKVVDRAGNLMVADGPVTEVVQAQNTDLLTLRESATSGRSRGHGITSAPDQLIAWETSPLTGWTVYFEQPIATAFAGADGAYRAQLWRIVAFGAIAFLGALGAAGALQVHARHVREAEAEVARERLGRELLVAALSHDIRNPMTAINGFAALITRPNVSRERSIELAQALQVEVRRVSRLLASLVDAVADEMPAAEASAEELELVSVVRNLVQDVSIASARQISVDSPEQNLYGRWEQQAVERAIENLISNACKYSEPDSEVRVRVFRDDREARAEAVVEVEDQGIGIPPAELRAVLAPFQRGSNVGTTSGSGIGLASVKQVVEQLGGAIAIRSQERKGTTVTLRLPLSTPPDEPTAREGESAGPQGSETELSPTTR